MRYPATLALAIAAALPVSLLPTSALAQTAAPMLTRTVSSDAAHNVLPLKELAAPVAKLDYDQLRKSYQIQEGTSLESVRADPKGNAGRVVELSGKISGVMISQGVRNVILESSDGTAVFVVKPELNGANLLTAGKSVRGLFLVGEENGDAVFSPIAVADYVETRSLYRSPYGAESTQGLEGLDTMAIEGMTIVPPLTDFALPRPQPALRTVPQRVGNRMIAPMAVESNGNWFSGQTSTYSALARRFNPRLTAAQANEIGGAILSASQRHSMDPRFLSTMIAVESRFDIYALSSSGAMGLGQIMPFNLKSLGIRNAWSPTENIHGAAKMLRQNLNSFKNHPDATLLAVAAYNAGPNAVKRAGYKVPNGQQVQRYVWKVYNQYKALAPDLFASR
jgi:hypothetical protein